MRRAVLVGTLAALVICSAAAAHGGGAKLGYRSIVTHVTPHVSGVTFGVLYGDDELQISDTGGRRIVVQGYEGEPYLLFTRDAVYRNDRSPATYLNDDRYGQVDVPKTANAKAAPVWKPVAAGVEYAWHDHRIHWMSTVPPPVVRNAKDVPHHIFDWTIPGTVDGKPMTIAGSLDYSPPGGGLPWEWILAGLVVLAAAATWAYQRWRSPRRSA